LSKTGCQGFIGPNPSTFLDNGTKIREWLYKKRPAKPAFSLI